MAVGDGKHTKFPGKPFQAADCMAHLDCGAQEVQEPGAVLVVHQAVVEHTQDLCDTTV